MSSLKHSMLLHLFSKLNMKKMKRILTFTLFAFFTMLNLQAQSIEELKTKKADLEAKRAAEQAKADAFNGEIGDLAKQIEILSGWDTGLSGLVGLNLGGSNNWVANANRNSSFSTLNIGVNAHANIIKEKFFWRNTLVSNIGWQGLDNNTDDKTAGTGFLNDRNVDALIGSSLYGYRLNQDIAVSILGDLNTSVFSFLKPGTFDISAGATITPHKIPNLVLVIHPLAYHFAFSALDNVSSQSAVGAKIKATYSYNLTDGIVWSTNLGAFLPYSNERFPIEYNKFNSTLGADELIMDEATLFEYTWINTISIANVWKGIGVGLTFGMRGAKFEFPDIQTYNAIGFTYGF